MERYRPTWIVESSKNASDEEMMKPDLFTSTFNYQVALLSGSKIKKNAVNNVLSRWRVPKCINRIIIGKNLIDTSKPFNFIVHGVNIDGTPDQVEQPLEWEGGFGAAKNRFNTAKSRDSDFLERYDIILIIENYMTLEGDDYACILLYDCHNKLEYHGKYFCAKAENAELLKRVIDAKNHPLGSPITYGKLLNELDSNIPANDWMSAVTGKPRQVALEEGLEKLSRGYLEDNKDLHNIMITGFETYSDFPKPGVLFKDWRPLFDQGSYLLDLIQLIVKPFDSITKKSLLFPDGKVPKVNYIAGLESRGLWIAPLIACELDCGMIPIRKPGKLPGKTKSVEYKKEYGTDKLEISTDYVPGNVLIVDDILATGGSMKAAIELVESCGHKVIGCTTVSDVPELRDMAKSKLKTNGQYEIRVIVQEGLRASLITRIEEIAKARNNKY
tara:strand:- start:4390 stop:5718 length:1329 start_codon:yes stop_codon:yes gene_type:complete